METSDHPTETSSNNPWEPTKAQGLFKHKPSGRYYSRIRHNGKRPYVALKTDVWSKALAKHTRRQADIAEKRANSPEVLDQTARTLGDFTNLLKAQLELTGQSGDTKINYLQHLAILRAQWPNGSYDHSLPDDVSFDTLLALRERLKTAKWIGVAGRGGRGGQRAGEGYSNSYINAVLARLNNVLMLARSRGACSHDPFTHGGGLQGTIWLPLPKRTKDLPSLERFHAIFAEMVNVVPGENGRNGSCVEEPAFVEWRRQRAIEASEHARFLAFTGARLEEGNAATFEDETVDDKGRHWFRIRGTKSSPSDRVIYVFPPLRELLAEIRARRTAAGEPVVGRILRPKTSRDAIKKACERLKMPKMGHHTLRHYFATLALAQGTPVRIVADWLGHSDGGALLLKTYAHVIREDSARWGEKLSFQSLPAQSNGE